MPENDKEWQSSIRTKSLNLVSLEHEELSIEALYENELTNQNTKYKSVKKGKATSLWMPEAHHDQSLWRSRKIQHSMRVARTGRCIKKICKL